MLKHILFILLFVSSSVMFSQTKTDSLLKRINDSNDTLVIAETCLELSYEYAHMKKDDMLIYIDRGINASLFLNDHRITADLYYMKAVLHDYHEEWNSSKDIYYIAAKYYYLIRDSVNLGRCYSNTGLTNYFYGNFKEAEKDYTIALKCLSQSDDFVNTAKLYNNFALLYKSQGNYVEAINKYLESLEIKEKIKDTSGIATTYQNIGVLFWEQKNYDEALSNYEKAVQLYKELNDSVGEGSIYLNMGLIYKEKNDTSSAVQYNDIAISLLQKTNYKLGLSSAYTNKAVLLDEAGDYESAEYYFLESLSLCEEIDYHTGILVNKISLSSLYSELQNRSLSQKYANEAVQIAQKSNSLKYLSDAYYILSNNHKDLGQYKSAYQYLKKYTNLKDSLFSADINKQINEIKTKYETEKKEVKINLLEKEAEIQTLELDKKNKRLSTIYIILLLTLTSLIIISVLFLQKRKAYLSLVEQNIKLARKDLETEKQYADKSLQTEKRVSDSGKPGLKSGTKQMKELIEDMVILMEEEKFFLNSGFTVNDFAKKLKSNRSYISQIIREHFHTNFNNFVNEYRIKEARKLLISEEYKNYSIEGIASLAGFHSKATFNSAFKKFTGVTPSFFQKNSENF